MYTSLILCAILCLLYISYSSKVPLIIKLFLSCKRFSYFDYQASQPLYISLYYQFVPADVPDFTIYLTYSSLNMVDSAHKYIAMFKAWKAGDVVNLLALETRTNGLNNIVDDGDDTGWRN